MSTIEADEAHFDIVSRSADIMYHLLWLRAKAMAKAKQRGVCGCDHHEYCRVCFPPELRPDGAFSWDKQVEHERKLAELLHMDDVTKLFGR